MSEPAASAQPPAGRWAPPTHKNTVISSQIYQFIGFALTYDQASSLEADKSESGCTQWLAARWNATKPVGQGVASEFVGERRA